MSVAPERNKSSQRRIYSKSRRPRPYLPGEWLLLRSLCAVLVICEVLSVLVDRRPRIWRRFRAHESQLKSFRVREERVMVGRASEDENGEDEEWTNEGDDVDEALRNQQRDLADRNVETMEQAEAAELREQTCSTLVNNLVASTRWRARSRGIVSPIGKMQNLCPG